MARGDGNMANENCLRLGGGGAYKPLLLPRTISRGPDTAAAFTSTAAPEAEAVEAATVGVSDETDSTFGDGVLAPAAAARAGPEPDS